MERAFTPDELLDRWEDQREIKNLMGRYANWIILNKVHEILDLYWSKEKDDICYGVNDGFYSGREALKNYYQAIYDGNVKKAHILRDIFPERLGDKSEEELYGIGPFIMKPLGSPYIEIAADGETAKGLWHSQGSYAEIGSAGPVSYWTWGYFAVDFVREGEDWKIWHMQYVEDINCPCGQNWGKNEEPYPDLPEFAELKDFRLPEPNVPVTLREYYTPRRRHTPAPRLPEAYTTFSETFSYGV